MESGKFGKLEVGKVVELSVVTSLRGGTKKQSVGRLKNLKVKGIFWKLKELQLKNA